MNKLDKNKSPIAIIEEIEKQAKYICEEFSSYTDGYRVLLLLQRHKEDGETNNSQLKKIITRNRKEYYEALIVLLRVMREAEVPLRIYASLNARDFNKSVRQFKFEQLEADYYDQVQKENFYLEIRNRFVWCLMQPQQRATNLFMFDIDNIEGRDVMGEALCAIPNEHILKQYPTKNGWHIITKPFNYTDIKLHDNFEFKKDGLLLLAY